MFFGLQQKRSITNFIQTSSKMLLNLKSRVSGSSGYCYFLIKKVLKNITEKLITIAYSVITILVSVELR